GTDRFSALFGTFNRIFLKDQEGLSFLILESEDAATDAARFRSAGIGVSDAMRFEREGKRPDGSAVKVAFSLAFARDAKAPAIGFAVCQQHRSEERRVGKGVELGGGRITKKKKRSIRKTTHRLRTSRKRSCSTIYISHQTK